MKYRLNVFALFLAFAVGMPDVSAALDLKGTVLVNQTSDTAVNAKMEAMNSARRQILFEILSNYSEIEPLQVLLENTSDDVLMEFVSATNVANEHISPETYSAAITMKLDNDAVKKWLTMNEVQNWVPDMENTETFSLFITISNGIADWADLKNAAHSVNVEIGTLSMVGNQIYAKMPLISRAKFTAAIRESGWKYADNNGVLQIWK